MWSNKHSVLILDFGGQYTQLIARRVREQKVYCEIHPFNLPLERIRAMQPAGIVLSGGPSSVYDAEAPRISPEVFDLGVPILGICYGVQLASHLLGGKVQPSDHREYGRAQVKLTSASELLAGFQPSEEISVWMSHGDRVEALPPGFKAVGTTPSCPVAIVESEARRFYGVQFHPEVVHTPRGGEILANFLFRICQCQPTWTMASFVDEAVAAVSRQVGKRPGDLRAVGRGGLVGGGGAGAQGDRRPADLHLREQRPAAGERDRPGGIAVPGRVQAGPAGGRRVRALPVEAGGGDRPRAEAEDHRLRVHLGVRGGGEAAGGRGLPGAGDAVPRRHRVGVASRARR